MTQVAIGIGSNMDRENNVRQAVKSLSHEFGALSCSPVYESEASGFNGPPFYNLVATFETVIDALGVCDKIRAIEIFQGRQLGNGRAGSRTLDIDLLLYGDSILYDIDLDVPRREIIDHAYILKPLADLLPGMSHPVTGESFGLTWLRCGARQESLSLVTELVL